MPDGWRSADDLANFYFDLHDAFGLDNVALVGASFGGWIAAEMAVRGSKRISQLVLTDALGIKLGGRTDRDIADFHNNDAALLESLKWADPTGR